MMKYVEFESGANTLRGMIHLPAQRPAPAVVFCHGFTGNRIENHFLFVTIARQLERLGIASLRFDFAGSGESDGLFEEMTTSQELADAEAALEVVRGQEGIDPRRIGVVGLSLGGAVAALLAARRSADVKSVALLAGVADPARIVSFIRQGKYELQLATWGYWDMHGVKVSRAFLLDLEHIKPAEELGKFAGPVLVIHGTQDMSVPVTETRTWHEFRLNNPYPTRVEIIKDADHTFNSLEHTDKVCRLLESFFQETL